MPTYPIDYVPHVRLTMSGTIQSDEIFSMNIALANVDPDSLVDWEDQNQQEILDDVAADCVAWFGSVNNGISQDAVLRTVKLAPIGSNGLYRGPSVEKAVNQPGYFPVTSIDRKPSSVAMAVTLHSDTDLGRVKGRFYVPCPAAEVFADGRWSASEVEKWATHAEGFIDNLNNWPGVDDWDAKVVVASQGRWNYVSKGVRGTQRVPKGNREVTGVSVGRVPDVIRKRRNKKSEGRVIRPI